MAIEGYVVRAALATPRLALRACGASDRDRLCAIFRDPYVRRYLWDSRIVDVADVDAVLAASDSSFRAHGVGIWCVSERAPRPGEVIGFAGARPVESAELELIYGFLPAYWGRGYALEAARAVLARAFALGQPRVWAGTDLENKASERVMQRLGMRFDRRERVGGLPQIYYVIERADFAG
ncbi:MAG TPA: GNAT family N-acetyltransferase [Myxococcota bacterium]|nr:GNAT family N-acetyltransferase [Myxococcota bacterium]